MNNCKIYFDINENNLYYLVIDYSFIMVDYILYHYSLCPFSRKIRFLLNELGLCYKLEEVKFWNRSEKFLRLNPASETPVLVNKEKEIILVDSFVIAEYLIATHNQKDDLLNISYLGNDEITKAEIRRLEMWFDKKFYNEVSKYILEERVYNTFLNKNVDINTKRLRAGQKNLDIHLKYMEFLLKQRKWLAGENFSLADITAATQISSLDYLGEISWSKYKILKDWYITIKSKIAFQAILKDKVEGFQPSKNYSELDFD